MPWSVTLNGHAYTEADFAGNMYATTWPAFLADFAAHTSASLQASSTTAVVIGTGAKSLVVEADKPLGVGAPLRIASAANPTTHWMDAIVTAYSSATGALDVSVVGVAGSGTRADWQIHAGGGGYAVGTPVPVVQGGTGGTDPTTARAGIDAEQAGTAAAAVTAHEAAANPHTQYAMDAHTHTVIGGVDISRIIYGDNANKTTLTTTFNSALASGFYNGNAPIGAPTVNWYTLLHLRHYNEANNYACQLAQQFSPEGDLYRRNIENGVPGTWYKLWDTRNLALPMSKVSANRPGTDRIYRRDNDSSYNVQTTWDGSRWVLQGYAADVYHAACRVAYADAIANQGALATVNQAAQGHLKTTTASFSVSYTGTAVGVDVWFGATLPVILPGGAYGFMVEHRNYKPATSQNLRTRSIVTLNKTGTVSTAAQDTGYGPYIDLRIEVATTEQDETTSRTYTGYCQQRYVQASPPYDLGDGDVPLFVFALVDSLGNVLSTWSAEDPPWANNGPTDIRADLYWHGKAYKFSELLTVTLEQVRAGGASYEEYLAEKRNARYEFIEITQALKQRDMPLIPHPFVPGEGQTVVLLDPVSTLGLRELHDDGEWIADILHNRYLTIDNVPVERAGPPGVLIVPVKWKNTSNN